MLSSKPCVGIWGATGNCGRPAVDELMKKGCSVRIITRDPQKASKIFEELNNVEIVGYQDEDPTSLKRAFHGVDQLAINPPTTENRVEITRKIIEAAKESNVKHIVIISVPRAEMKSITFQKQFAEIEECLISTKIPYTILRANFFLDNYVNLLPFYKRQGKIFTATHSGHYCPVACADVGQAEADVLLNPTQHRNKTYTLTGPESMTANDLARAYSENCNTQLPVQDISPQQFSETMHSLGIEEWLANGIGELMEAYSRDILREPTQDFVKITGHTATSLDQLLQQHPALKA